MKLTLCGSARFESVWHEANKQLGLAGHICYSLMTFPSIEGDKSWYTEEEKWMLDLAHFAKIEESNAVLILNINNYLGESSFRELKWARMRNKSIYWLVPSEGKYDSQGKGEFLIHNFISDKAYKLILSKGN